MVWIPPSETWGGRTWVYDTQTESFKSQREMETLGREGVPYREAPGVTREVEPPRGRGPSQLLDEETNKVYKRGTPEYERLRRGLPAREPTKEVKPVTLFSQVDPDTGGKNYWIVKDGVKHFRGSQEYSKALEGPTVEQIIEARSAEQRAEEIQEARERFRAPRKPPTRKEARARFEELGGRILGEEPSFADIQEAGVEVSDIRMRDIVVARATEQPLVPKRREAIEEFAFGEPFPKTTIRPEIEEFKEVRGERAEKVTRETLKGLGEAAIDISVAYGGGLAFGAGLRGVRAVSRLKPLAKPIESVAAAGFAGITGVEVGKGIVEDDPGKIARTAAFAGAGVAGAIKGFGKAAPLEEIGLGVKALKGVRPEAKVTVHERIQLGLGRRAKVPKTLEEAIALQEALGPKPIADVALIEPKGEFEPTQVGEITTVIGGKKFTRPRFEEIASLEAATRKFEKGIFREIELAPETGFKEITRTDIFEFTERGKVFERRVLRREERVGEELLSVRELVGKSRRRGFLGEEAGEAAVGRTKPFEEFKPQGRAVSKIEQATKFDPKIKMRVEIFDVGIGPKIKPIAITTGLTKAEIKALDESLGITRPKAKVLPTAVPKIDTKLRVGTATVPDITLQERAGVITDVLADVDLGVTPFRPGKPPKKPSKITTDVIITEPGPPEGFGFPSRRPKEKKKKIKDPFKTAHRIYTHGKIEGVL